MSGRRLGDRLGARLARLRHLEPSELPFRAAQAWTLATDPLWTPPAARPGPALRWPVPLPSVEAPVQGADIELHGLGEAEAAAHADPRTRWERTRLHHLALAALDPAGDPAGVARDALASCGPPGSGDGWAAAIEVAIRLVQLVVIADRAGDGPHAAPLRAAVAAHAAWVHRHPSRGSSANNHRVAELGALALAGHALGEARWRREAEAELPYALAAQVHPDGAGVEQSPTYLAFDLEWALLARLCGVNGLDPTIERGSAFLAALVDDGLGAPRIGDDDGGRVIAVGMGPEPGYVGAIAGACRVALGRPAPPGWVPDLRCAALGIGAARAHAAPSSATFPDGGLTAIRRGPLLVVVDHGPLGGCALAAHGHADAGSVWIHVGDQPVVVDRGTWRYHDADQPGARRFDRGAGAHPTAVVDGRDPSTPHPSPFLWRTRATARAERVDLDLDLGRVALVVDGAAHGVVHRRTVTVSDDTHGWQVALDDRFEAAHPGVHHVAVQLPLDPGLAVDDRLGLWRDGERVGAVAVDPGCVARVVRGGARPGIGWHATSYGVQVPAAAIVVEHVARLPFATRVVITLAVPPGAGGSGG